MRVAGIYSPDGSGVEGFLNSMRSFPGNGDLERETLLYPPERPVIAVIFAKGLRVPVQWACRPDGSFIVIDGEIFDWATFPKPLGDDEPKPSFRAGELLDDYLKRGAPALSEIDGAAMLTIWDAPARRLVLARDRMGLTPGFHANRSGDLVWASHINSVIAAGVEREVFLPALDYFLGAHYVPSPWSFCSGIQKIPPAHTVTWAGAGDTVLERYWLPTGRPKFGGTIDEQVDKLEDLLTDAIRKRSAVNGRTGVLLSGGVDSMLVTGMASRLGITPETFTFRYTDYEGELNETEPARALADHFGLPHHVIPFRPSDIADNLDDMVRAFGEPFDYGVHTYMVGKALADADALLTGAGPDGWYLSPTSRFGLLVAHAPAVVRRVAEAMVPGVKLVSEWVAERVAGILQEARVGMPIVAYPRETTGPLRALLYRSGVYEHAGESLRPPQMARDFAALADESRHDRLTFAGINYFSADTILYWNNAWSRSYDLPIRHPYMDADLYSFLMRLPRREKNKLQFRELAARIMPREMAYGPKIYQAAPLANWFRGPLRELLNDRLAPDRIAANGLFDADAVSNLIRRHVSGEEDHGWLLMMLLTTTVWQELDR